MRTIPATREITIEYHEDRIPMETLKRVQIRHALEQLEAFCQANGIEIRKDQFQTIIGPRHRICIRVPMSNLKLNQMEVARALNSFQALLNP